MKCVALDFSMPAHWQSWWAFSATYKYPLEHEESFGMNTRHICHEGVCSDLWWGDLDANERGLSVRNNFQRGELRHRTALELEVVSPAIDAFLVVLDNAEVPEEDYQ